MKFSKKTLCDFLNIFILYLYITPLHLPLQKTRMSSVFTVDNDVELPESNRRSAYEATIGSKVPSLMSEQNIRRTMEEMGYYHIHDYSDNSNEFAADGQDTTEIFFQRDWTKFGFIRAPYHVYLSLPNRPQYYFRVCSLKKLKRVITWWKKRQANRNMRSKLVEKN